MRELAIAQAEMSLKMVIAPKKNPAQGRAESHEWDVPREEWHVVQGPVHIILRQEVPGNCVETVSPICGTDGIELRNGRSCVVCQRTDGEIGGIKNSPMKQSNLSIEVPSSGPMPPMPTPPSPGPAPSQVPRPAPPPGTLPTPLPMKV